MTKRLSVSPHDLCAWPHRHPCKSGSKEQQLANTGHNHKQTQFHTYFSMREGMITLQALSGTRVGEIALHTSTYTNDKHILLEIFQLSSNCQSQFLLDKLSFPDVSSSGLLKLRPSICPLLLPFDVVVYSVFVGQPGVIQKNFN